MERTQSTRDKILWEWQVITANSLDPIIDELERDGEIRRIERGVDKKGYQSR